MGLTNREKAVVLREAMETALMVKDYEAWAVLMARYRRLLMATMRKN